MKKRSIPQLLTYVLLLLVVPTLFILFGFVLEQPCDGIDNIYLYCRVHPFNFFDLIGTILFLFGCFWLSGVWTEFVKDDQDERLAKVKWYALLGAVFGMVLLWNL